MKYKTELLNSLRELINKYGFNDVIFTLEDLATESADFYKEWEQIRQKLEDIYKDAEEFNLRKDQN